MRFPNFKLKPIGSALFITTLLSACGGGGGGGPDTAGGGGITSPGNTQTEVPLPKPVSAPMTMSCADGSSFQCSGDTIIRIDNGLALTRSGVQVYGKSTNDQATTATGFALATGGIAEIRLSKDGASVVSKPALLLRNLGLSWDGKNERPPIIDDFNPTYGRTALDEDGKIVSLTLPDTTDLAFYDVATKGFGGTQANYANNRYFPRAYPSRCDAGTTSCPTAETSGIQRAPGDWAAGGTRPDWTSVGRLHGEGDVHAGDAQGGGPLPGGNGKGVPFPGSKGYRALDNWNLRYSNLGVWSTQDTVHIQEWGGADEHNKNRRGIVAFGDVTDPDTVPTSGSATYSGIAYGWHTDNGAGDPDVFWGTATLTVNFATRETTVTIGNTTTYDAAGIAIPTASFTATAKTGAAGQSVANYLTGPADNSKVKGGVSGRYFGPVSGSGPAEVAGAFSLSQSATGRTVIGGFIARRQ